MPRPPKSLKLPFAMQNGNLVHISDVPQGAACECFCPCCEAPLLARKGATKVHHFAHKKGAECAASVETALHLAAKKILEDRRVIALPAVQITFDSNRPPMPIAPARTFALDEVHAERRTGNIVPDILAYAGGAPLLIEIRVTHEVDEGKAAKVRALGISAVEIDLSSFNRNFTYLELADAVVTQIENRTWVFNSEASRIKNQLLATGLVIKTVNRRGAVHADGCPISKREWNGKAYANVTDDCLFCDYNLSISENFSTVICGGNRQIMTVEELLQSSDSP